MDDILARERLWALKSYKANVFGCECLKLAMQSESLCGGSDRWFSEQFSALDLLSCHSAPNCPMEAQYAEFKREVEKRKTKVPMLLEQMLLCLPSESAGISGKIYNSLFVAVLHSLFCKKCQQIANVCKKCGGEVPCGFDVFLQCLKQAKKFKLDYCKRCLQVQHAQCMSSDGFCHNC